MSERLGKFSKSTEQEPRIVRLPGLAPTSGTLKGRAKKHPQKFPSFEDALTSAIAFFKLLCLSRSFCVP